MSVKISVIIPTCNRPERVGAAIKSVLAQTFQDFEIIIVDDGLKKRAEKAVKEFDDKRIAYIQHEINKGGGAARNTGIKNAKADLIVFLDDDDEWYPEKLEKQYKIIKKYWEEIGFVFCRIELDYDEEDRIDKQNLKQIGINDLYQDLLAHKLRTLTSSLLIKKEALEKVKGFDVEFPSCQEWDMMIRISRYYKGYGMNEVLVKMHYLQGDHVGGNLSKRILGRELLLKKHFDELKKMPKVLAWHYFQLGIFCRGNEDFKKAGEYFLKAWGLNKIKTRYLLHFFYIYFLKIKLNLICIIGYSHVGLFIRSRYFKYYIRKIIIKNINVVNILDAGCGRALYSRLLAEMFPQAKVTGYDIKKSQDWEKNKRNNLFLIEKDITKLDENNIYDLIISIDVLEHIPKNKIVMEKIYKALKVGGFFYCTIPNDKAKKRLFPNKYFIQFDKWDAIEHIGEQYDLYQLKELMQTIGFKINFARYTFTFWGNLAWEINTILKGKKVGDKLNIILMPLYRILTWLDINFPLGKGNNLIIASK
ncbi:glycosyltransferase [Candidatus Parcubacteria bacterium]|nr:glycosyltransferase [Candidatus Parcubacteria bacterium]